jgi:hydrogenase maturation protease
VNNEGITSQESLGDESEPISLLVLGLGNLLCGDDGLGAAAVARLERDWEAPDGALFLDGGTLGLTLLPYLEDARDVILVDAVRADEPPGTLVVLSGEDVAPAVRHRLSPHQIGVADLLDGARLHERYPRRLVLVGLVPATLSLGIERSAAVETHLQELVEEVVAQARRLEHEFVRRTNRPSDSRDHGYVARVFGL